jgi:outer membrane protein OmpA-like peptidoglycan-associated protein
MLTQFEYGTGRMLSVQSSIIERFINPEITSRTAITITGFTDRKGDAQRNAELSVLRAREASANILGGARRVIRGEGEAGDALQPPFTNELPETRLYNRTVEILLRTPIR